MTRFPDLIVYTEEVIFASSNNALVKQEPLQNSYSNFYTPGQRKKYTLYSLTWGLH
jgi:hypothetical protein